MIDLFTVKLNNKYDYIQESLPAFNGTWLCSNSNDTYTKGHSYQVVDGLAQRIEQAEDYKIQSNLYGTIQLVCEYLNNFFYANSGKYADEFCYKPTGNEYDKCIYDYNKYTFEDNNIFPVKTRFNIKDLVRIAGERNNCISYVTDFLGEQLTVDNNSLVNTREDAAIVLMNLPSDIQITICQIIHYDAFLRENPDNIKSESIGNYSYTKNDAIIGGLYYPYEMISKLNAYKKVRFV